MKEILKNKKILIICAVIATVLIITIVGILIAVGNGAFKNEEDLKGKYDLVEMEEDGRVTTTDDLEMLNKFGISTTLEIKNDKTGTIDMMGEKEDFKIEGNAFKTEEETMNYSIQWNKIVVQKNNSKLTFEKQAN